MRNNLYLLHQKTLKCCLNCVTDVTTGSTGRSRFVAVNLYLEFNCIVVVWLISQYRNIYSHILIFQRLSFTGLKMWEYLTEALFYPGKVVLGFHIYLGRMKMLPLCKYIFIFGKILHSSSKCNLYLIFGCSLIQQINNLLLIADWLD